MMAALHVCDATFVSTKSPYSTRPARHQTPSPRDGAIFILRKEDAMISRTVTQPPGEPMEAPEETIHPDPEVVANAWVGDWRALEERAAADLEGYWAERAGELEWSRPWDTVLDESGAPFYRWFVGARTNIVSNAVDRHLTNSHRNKLALIWVGEDV